MQPDFIMQLDSHVKKTQPNVPILYKTVCQPGRIWTKKIYLFKHQFKWLFNNSTFFSNVSLSLVADDVDGVWSPSSLGDGDLLTLL